MTKRSFYDFQKQFTNKYIDDVKVPYNVLLQTFSADVTTYDDILNYFDINISSDGTSISCNMAQQVDDSYIYPETEPYPFTFPNDINYIYDYYYTSDTPKPHWIGLKLLKDSTSLLLNKPFEDTTISMSETRKMHPTPSIEMYYSSYNDHLILPKNELMSDENFMKFATDIYKFANDTTKTEYDHSYELYLFNPSALVSLNKNFKFNFHFDSSLLGVKNTNDFQWNPNKKY
jgi:hypothetical protein